MAGKNSLFRIMKDAAGNVVGLTGLQIGEAIGTKVAALVAGYQDQSGNAAVPTLNADGSIAVSFDSGICKTSPFGSQAGTTTLTALTGVEITLTASKVYSKLEGVVSAMSESCFQIIHDDDGTETVLAEFQTGPGQYTVDVSQACIMFTAGATGTQKLLVKASNADADEASDLKAVISINEAP